LRHHLIDEHRNRDVKDFIAVSGSVVRLRRKFWRSRLDSSRSVLSRFQKCISLRSRKMRLGWD